LSLNGLDIISQCGYHLMELFSLGLVELSQSLKFSVVLITSLDQFFLVLRLKAITHTFLVFIFLLNLA
jgi:hypothetical protein